MATTRIKASDRTKVCQQVVTILKKQYGNRLPAQDHDVLETVLFAICLENTTFPKAEAALKRLHELFFDYNEIRVSSITELQQAFEGLSAPEWRAMRIRDTLQCVFEGTYSYELEELRKKTIDAAEKQLLKIHSLSPFVMNHTLLFALGSHLFPVDDSLLAASIWLGLLEEETTLEQAADHYKAAIRKTDVPLFYYLMNCLANDEQYQGIFMGTNPEKSDQPLEALNESTQHLKKLLAGEFAYAAPVSAPPTPKQKTKAEAKAESKAEPKTAKSKEVAEEAKSAPSANSKTKEAPKKAAAAAPKKSTKTPKKKT